MKLNDEPSYVAKCDGCGKELIAEEVEVFYDGYCHTVPSYSRCGEEWDLEPEPCGPVYMIEPAPNKPNVSERMEGEE